MRVLWENKKFLYGGNLIMKTKRTWVYCRVAHDGPDSATMLAVQQCKLGIYAKKHDFEIVGSPSDTGNGLTFDRPGLMNF